MATPETRSASASRAPDVVETAAAVGGAPVGGAIAPPRVELLRLRREPAHAVDPAAGAERGSEFLAFDRRVRDHPQHLLVAPDVVLARRDIEIADQDGALRLRRPQRRGVAHLIEEGKLVGEFRIDRRIGNVAAGRDIEIMHRDRIAQPGALAEHRGDMAAIGLAAETLDVEAFERQSRKHDDAVIALLAVERDVLVAEPLETLARKSVVRALGLLQAKDVGPDRLDEFGDQIDAQPHRIDVPGRELDLHGRRIWGSAGNYTSITQHVHHPRRRMIQYPQAIETVRSPAFTDGPPRQAHDKVYWLLMPP